MHGSNVYIVINKKSHRTALISTYLKYNTKYAHDFNTLLLFIAIRQHIMFIDSVRNKMSKKADMVRHD